MTDKERLEEIKEVYEWSVLNSLLPRMSDSDIEWLIEQVEKSMTCQEVLDLQKDALKGLLEQNKRYREVVTQAISDLENECLWDALVKLKSLEEESE